MRQEKSPLLILVCLAAVFGAMLLAGCRTPFVPYFLSRNAPEADRIQEQAAEQPVPEEISDQAATPEQVTEETVAAGSDSSKPPEPATEAVPEEIPKPLPELKVKGHF